MFNEERVVVAPNTKPGYLTLADLRTIRIGTTRLRPRDSGIKKITLFPSTGAKG